MFLLGVPGKFFEKVLNQLRQYGFRRWQSTGIAIAIAYEKIAEASVTIKQQNISYKTYLKHLIK